MFQGWSPAGGEIIDIAGHLVGHHQRQIRVRGLDFRCCFGLQVRINRIIRDRIGFINGRWFGLLLGSGIALLHCG